MLVEPLDQFLDEAAVMLRGDSFPDRFDLLLLAQPPTSWVRDRVSLFGFLKGTTFRFGVLMVHIS